MKAQATTDLALLDALIARLRAPDGCPWDREQTLPDLRAYLLEEAHEAAGAIAEGDLGELAVELGDLLFQAVFVAQVAAEQGGAPLAEVIRGIHAKMVERHPHVFGDTQLADAEAVRQAWERRKLAAQDGPRAALLAGVPRSLPSLVAAYRMTQKAAAVGFDWPDVAAVLAKVREELAEVEGALAVADPESRKRAVQEEIGDLLFAVANLARHCELDPDTALAASNHKFRRRFAAVEEAIAESGRKLGEVSLAEMDRLWDDVKAREKT